MIKKLLEKKKSDVNYQVKLKYTNNDFYMCITPCVTTYIKVRYINVLKYRNQHFIQSLKKISEIENSCHYDSQYYIFSKMYKQNGYYK